MAGLYDQGERKRKDFATKPAEVRAIDWLRPDSDQHAFVLQHIRDRINYSQQRMSSFWPRWRQNELRLQAYMSLGDFEQQLKTANDDRRAPSPVQLTVPYAWATVNTIVTYLLHMFAGRKPIFQVGSYHGNQVKQSANMELLLQYNADCERLIRAIYFFLMDGETYGVAILRNMWKVERRDREIIAPPSEDLVLLGQQLGRTVTGEKRVESYVAFEGNSVANIDPFMFFPDPRVPMHEVNEKGEWTAWRSYQGRHVLKKAEALGQVKWINNAGELPYGRSTGTDPAQSARGVRSLGAAHPGTNEINYGRDVAPNYQIDQGTFIIIPKDLGLSDSETPETWLFTMVNERQIIQAERLVLNHGRHPVTICEPNSFGYAFGNLGTVDMLSDMQDMMSWLINSHMFNVRAALNNMFVVDPTKIDMNDLANPKPGKLIKLKNTPFGGMDPRMAVMQLPVSDITRSHINDFNLFGRMAADLTGATDNVRGLQDAGGRKTATEVRTTSEAGSSRLAAKGKIYSSMAFTDLASQMASNFQQFLSQEMELRVLGENAIDTVRIDPQNIQGDFYYPVHDGTLPIDKVGMLDVWVQIFQAVQGDQELRQTYSLAGIFDFMAQLGGAQNIHNFKNNPGGQQALIPPMQTNVMPDDQLAAAAAAGNMVPLADATAQLART